MVKHLFAASAMLLCTVGPAMAIAPQCEDQIRELSEQMQQQKSGNKDLEAKLDQAKRLCDQHQDQQAQDMARQIRQEMAGAGSSDESTKGSSGSTTSEPPSQK